MPTLLTLPREMRDEIYFHVVPLYDISGPSPNHTVGARLNAPQHTSELTILLVNRQISAEAALIFYRRNRFRIPDNRDQFKSVMSKRKGTSSLVSTYLPYSFKSTRQIVEDSPRTITCFAA